MQRTYAPVVKFDRHVVYLNMASKQESKFERPPALAANPTVIYPYVVRHLRESPLLGELREHVATLERARMMGAPDVAALLGWLCRLTNAKRAIEVGTFRGYTTLALAEALPADGRVTTLDISTDFVTTAKPFWERSGHAHKIDLRMAPAAESMQAMLDAGEGNTIDLVFIDADKLGYPQYYELAVQLLKPGGIIAVDNTLWGGTVATESAEQMDKDTATIAALNESILRDSRVDALLLPIADGLYLARKLVSSNHQ